MAHPRIEGGYYIKARSIADSDIMRSPPYVREVWDWLLMNANHKDNKSIKRGQIFTTLDDICEGLCWFVGYRKVSYTKDHMKKAMRALKKASMITTNKSTRGFLITVCNYEIYQNPKNYESTSESTNESTTKAPSKHHESPHDKQECKNERKKENIYPDWLPLEAWNNFLEMRKGMKKPATEPARQKLISILTGLKEKGYDPTQIIENSLVNNWLGFFEPNNRKGYQSTAKPRSDIIALDQNEDYKKFLKSGGYQ
jgi:hypothetical protein